MNVDDQKKYNSVSSLDGLASAFARLEKKVDDSIKSQQALLQSVTEMRAEWKASTAWRAVSEQFQAEFGAPSKLAATIEKANYDLLRLDVRIRELEELRAADAAVAASKARMWGAIFGLVGAGIGSLFAQFLAIAK